MLLNDSKFGLCSGVLRLELPKEVYERVGLVGTPIRDGGRKHLKSRYGRRDCVIAKSAC